MFSVKSFKLFSAILLNNVKIYKKKQKQQQKWDIMQKKNQKILYENSY